MLTAVIVGALCLVVGFISGLIAGLFIASTDEHEQRTKKRESYS